MLLDSESLVTKHVVVVNHRYQMAKHGRLLLLELNGQMPKRAHMRGKVNCG